MPRYVLDTSALLTLHYDEAGSERVAGLLTRALEPETPVLPGVAVFACFMSLMEVLYRVWKTEGEAAGRAAYAACQALPLGDAWIAATALQCDAVLVHKDPEFESLPGLVEERLPYK